MYRALALLALRRNISTDDGEALGELAANVDIEVGERVLVDGEDVTDGIRSEEISRAVSAVAIHPEVRQRMAAVQRSIAQCGDVVVEGRDIGSKVLPRAEAKIFLTASVDERAVRRAEQLGVSDDPKQVDEIGVAIAERDRSDSQRAVSPLMKARGALEVDSTGKGIDVVVDEIVEAVREALS
jgi:cytidylate kinase